MRTFILVATAATLSSVLTLIAGCGVESLGTAATAAAIKKQEIDQGKKTMEVMQDKVNAAAQLTQQRVDSGAEEK